jgi:RNA polymerase sigma-70 factor (ECF subfamily)
MNNHLSIVSLDKEKKKAFNAMLLRNKALIWHICSDYSLGKAWHVEDCMQEVIVSLWRYFETFEGRSSERTWIYRVATNTMLMLRRKDNKSPITERIDNQKEINNLSYEGQDENYQQLLQFINELPEENSMIIRAHLDGFSYQEIAAMTNLTESAVAMRIVRIKKQLKEMYDNENNKIG